MNKETYDLINKNAHDLYLALPRLNPVDAAGCPVCTDFNDFNVCKLQAIGALLKWVVEAETPRPNDSLGLIRWLRTYEEITKYDIIASEKALAKCEAAHEEWKKKWGIEE